MDCLKCHSGGKGVPDSKCLDCHKEIKSHVDTKHGYHGQHKKNCLECHSDHKGRDYDSVKIDEKKFDHNLTTYKLEGKHADIKCVDCHTEKRAKKPIRPQDTRYFGKTTTCVSCHKKDDVHFFKGDYAKKDCNVCHGLKTWKDQIQFKHDTFKLEGKHSKLECKECHVPKGAPSARYQWKDLKKQECLSCHQNYHSTGLSTKFTNGHCISCHNQTQWKFTKDRPFDHSVTKYELRGKHSEIECTECHKAAIKVIAGTKAHDWKGLKTSCVSCHEDYHRYGNHRSKLFMNPLDCSKCHGESNWKKTNNFNHDVHTRYTITGKHQEVTCNVCHISKDWKVKTQLPGRYHWQQLDTKTCESCHASPHLKTFSKELLKKKCTDCHVTDGWKIIRKGKGDFSHDRDTRFKIVGAHTPLKCEQCHTVNKKTVYRFEGADKNFCITCHASVHKGQFSKKFFEQSCSECHTQKDFKTLLPFDHSDTRYKLEGTHRDLKCSECHKPTQNRLNVALSIKGSTASPKWASQYLFTNLNNKTCAPCHANVHEKQFSPAYRDRSCLECHNQMKFTDRKPFDHEETRFPLVGKHEELKCEKCHVLTNQFLPTKPPKRASQFHFANLSKSDCASCHRDPHEGGFGNACSECHNEKGWKATKDFHKEFRLGGVHFTLQCKECHTADRRLAGLSQNCYLCHQKDDVHQGSLPNCGECHRQHFWENAEYKHSLTRFPLRGSHRVLDCNTCHKNGIYQGAPNRCIDCHLNDATAVAFPPHLQPIFENCARCHNQFSFK